MSPEFWVAIKKGRLHIPGETIRPFIEEALANEENARLQQCTFQEDGITLEVGVKKAGSRITLPLTVTLDRVRVDGEEQTLEAGFACDGPMGDNLLGRLAAAVAKGLIFKMVAGRMADNPDATVSNADRGRGRVVVDLGDLKPIRRLDRKLPILNKSVLDLVAVHGARHVENGVELKLGRGGRRAEAEA